LIGPANIVGIQWFKNIIIILTDPTATPRRPIYVYNMYAMYAHPNFFFNTEFIQIPNFGILKYT